MIKTLKDKLFSSISNDVKVIRDPMGDLRIKIIFVIAFTVLILSSFYVDSMIKVSNRN